MPSLLIVDDTPLITATIARLAREADIGFDTVAETRNGLEAVDYVRRKKPDIVIMDIKMPGMDGLKAAEIIRSEHPATRIVFLTAYDEFSYAHAALKLGPVDYLLKPIRSAKLIEILKQIVDGLGSEAAGNAAQKGGHDAVPVQAMRRDPVKRAIAHIQKNYDQSKISLGDVAEAAHLSPSHLAHVFKEATGLSYKQYLTAQRMNAAKHFLQNTDWTIDVIAEKVGYSNVTNFYRLFQRETGQTPTTFRRWGGTPPEGAEDTAPAETALQNPEKLKL